MTRSARLSLSWLLVAGVLIEVVLRRIVVRLLELHVLGLAGSGRVLYGAARLIGQFALTFSGVLALAICTWAIVLLLFDRRILGTLPTLLTGASAAVLLPVAAIGLFVAPHPAADLTLSLAFAALLAAFMLALLRRGVPWRPAIGLLYLASLLLLRSLWLAEQQVGVLLAWPPRHVGWTVQAYGLADHLLAASGVVVFVCFAPLSRWRDILHPLGLAASAVVVASAVGLWRHDYPLAEMLAQRALNLQLPGPGSLELVLYLLALLPFTLTLAGLLRGDQGARASANGLLLIALSGYHLLTAQQILVTLVGLLQLLRATLRDPPPVGGPAPSVEQWKRYLARLALGCKDAKAGNDALVVQSNGGQVARVRSALDGIPYAVRLAVRGGRVEELELDIGQPPNDDPPATLVRARGCRGVGMPGGKQPRIKTFDRQFRLRDGTGELSRTLTPLLGELRGSIHGWLGIWPAEGLRYLARPLGDGWPVSLSHIVRGEENADIEPLRRLVRLLVDLARRLDIRA